MPRLASDDKVLLEHRIMMLMMDRLIPYSAAEVSKALRTDYRQTLAALHRLHRAGKLKRTFFHGANLSAYWYENPFPF